jgi:hypothetical protein
MNYWAELDLNGEKRTICFRTEQSLNNQGLLSQIEELRKNYKLHQKNVCLTSDDVRKLENEGIKVIPPSFLALNGRWHWFTGYWKKDAFQLDPQFENRLIKEDIITINL